MLTKRLYVGNLPENISGSEVSSKFSHFGTIQSCEVKTKNDATFAFISINVEDENQVEECIRVLNNTKWRGNLMKVQLAKESFLDRLKREQEENKKRMMTNGSASGVTSTSSDPPNKPPDMREDRQYKKPAKTNGSVKPPKRQKKEESDDSSDSDDSDDDQAQPLPAFRGLLAYPELNSDVQVTQNGSDKVENEVTTKPKFQEKSEKPEAQNNPLQNKLLKIASSDLRKPTTVEKPKPFVPPVKTVGVPSSVKWNVSKEAEQPAYDNLQNKLLAIAGVASKKNSQSNHHHQQEINSVENAKENRQQGPLNFRKRDSDALRQKSLEARWNMNQTRSSIIKSSLSNAQIQPPAESKEPSKLSSALFGDEDDEEAEGEENTFKIRPQFEGNSGEKNLELSSKFATFDNRFALDQRFREDEEDEEGTAQNNNVEEKEKMFSILSDVLGSTVAPKPKPKEPTVNKSIIIQRYDPENPTEIPSATAEQVTPASKDHPKFEPLKPNSVEKPAEAPKEAEYHVAPNLKDLFTKNSGSFSLLKEFGTAAESDDQNEGTRKPQSSKSQNFWEGKKFKYDSSDSEDEEELPSGTSSGQEVVGRGLKEKDRFFFKKNDKRFEGLEDFFLHNQENMDDVVYRFHNGEREELRQICKNKCKNAKRKSEKRMEALRRLKRKLKNKRKSKRTPQGSNAVPIGAKKKAK